MILRRGACDIARCGRVLSLYAGKLRWRASTERERIGGMGRIGRHRRAFLWVAGILALLMLCVLASYASYNGGLVESIGAGAYQNTSAPASLTRDGVTLSATHSRYVAVETITLTVTNRSSAPIYVPDISRYYPLHTEYSSTPFSCLAIETEFLDSYGWRSLGRGCNWSWTCPGGALRSLPAPGVLMIAPGQTVDFPLYDGEDSYPPWSPGAYRFDFLFTRTPLQASRGDWPTPLAIPHSELLTTPPVTLTNAWWIPPQYHHTPPRCPFAA